MQKYCHFTLYIFHVCLWLHVVAIYISPTALLLSLLAKLNGLWRIFHSVNVLWSHHQATHALLYFYLLSKFYYFVLFPGVKGLQFYLSIESTCNSALQDHCERLRNIEIGTHDSKYE